MFVGHVPSNPVPKNILETWLVILSLLVIFDRNVAGTKLVELLLITIPVKPLHPLKVLLNIYWAGVPDGVPNKLFGMVLVNKLHP